MIRRTEDDVLSKETIILWIYGNCELVLYNELNEDSLKGMKKIVSMA